MSPTKKSGHFTPVELAEVKRLRSNFQSGSQSQEFEFEEEMSPPVKQLRKKQRVQKATVKYGRLGAKCGKSKPEVKFLDTSITSNLTTAGTFISLNSPVFGTEFYQRVGNSMCLKSISINGGFQYAYNVSAVQDYVRLAIVYDKQPNAAFPTNIGTVFQEVYDNAGTASFAESSLNPVQKDRFIVLWQQRFALPGAPTITTGNSPVTLMVNTNDLKVDKFIKLGNMETRFNTTNGGTIADITSGALIWVSDATDNAPSANCWSFYGTARLRFTD